jgi:hypothetical protein
MLILKQNPELFVTVFSGSNIHCDVCVRNCMGIKSLKKGEAFDFSERGYWDNAVPRFRALTDYYVDDPEDEVGCVNAVQTYNPEI